MKFTYTPAVGEPDVVDTFGHVFAAGDPVDVTNEKAIAKLKGNPHFKGESEKAIDGRTREAREARARAADMGHDPAAKERAAEQAAAIADAQAEKAKDEQA